MTHHKIISQDITLVPNLNSAIVQSWQPKPVSPKVCIYAFPFDGGQDRSGTHLGPQRLLDKGLFKQAQRYQPTTLLQLQTDSGTGYQAPYTGVPEGRAFIRNSEAIKAQSHHIAEEAYGIASQPFDYQLGLFGDHSMEGGHFLGLKRAYGEDLQLFFVDAHGDSHTPESSPSKNFHGMMLGSLILGTDTIYKSNPLSDTYTLDDVTLGVPFTYQGKTWFKEKPLNPENLTIFGTTSTEPAEDAIFSQFKKMGATVFTAQDIQHLGIKNVTQLSQQKLSKNPGYISLDVDVTEGITNTGTPEGVIPFDHVYHYLRGLKQTGALRGSGIFEMNPTLHPEESALDKDTQHWLDYATVLLGEKTPLYSLPPSKY